MKRTYYDAEVTLKATINGIYRHRWEGYKKITYEMNGEQVKIYLYSRRGFVISEEFSNVASVKVIKYKK